MTAVLAPRQLRLDLDLALDRTKVRELAVAAGFAVLSIVMTFPQVWRLTTHVAGDGGDALFILWTMRWVNHAALHGGWDALWDPNVFAPAQGALAYSDTLLPVAPVFGLLSAITGSTALALNLVALSTWTATQWCAYRLLRRFVDATAPAALAAVAFTFTTMHLAQYRHLQLVIGGLLTGIVLLLLRFFDKPTPWRGLALGSSVAAMTLTASYYGLAAGVIVVVGVLVHVVHTRARLPWPAFGVGLAVALGAVVVVVAPFASRYASLSSDPAMRRVAQHQFDAVPSDLLAVSVDNRLVGDLWPVAGRDVGKTSENLLFPGYVQTALAVVGVGALVRGRRRPQHGLGVLVAAGAVLGVLALGDVAFIDGREAALPFAFVRELVPGFDGVRVPARFMLVPMLALAGVAAVGAAAVGRRFGAAALVVLGALVVAETATSIELVRVDPRPTAVAVNEVLATRAPGTVVELPMRTAADGAAWPFVEVGRQVASTVDWHPRVNGHSGFEPPSLRAAADALNTFPSPASLDVLAMYDVRYVIIRTELAVDLGAARERVYGREGVGVRSDSDAWAMIAAIPADRLASAEHIGSSYLIELRT